MKLDCCALDGNINEKSDMGVLVEEEYEVPLWCWDDIGYL